MQPNEVKQHAKEIIPVPLSDIKLYPRNTNTHDDEQIEELVFLIKNHGYREPGIISTLSGCLVAGEGRYLASKRLKLDSMPVMYQDFESEDAEFAFATSTNAIAGWAKLNLSKVNSEILPMGPDFDIRLLGIKDFEIEVADKYGGKEKAPTLADRFLVPPFSVLDARQGYWQDRKRQWLSLGIQSEIGRGGHQGSTQDSGQTLGAIAPNQATILKRTGKYS